MITIREVFMIDMAKCMGASARKLLLAKAKKVGGKRYANKVKKQLSELRIVVR
jgi:hypothetical protein